jgi:aspartyl-tRNA(Asn)/glutamyl-tRNA(Gln) amidotransferase subunit A
VAAGLGALAIGTDGAGSIRIPSFYNGIYGLKPTFGRIPHDGWKGAPYTSHQGPMTRTVRDAALIMQAASGPDQRDSLCMRDAPPNFLEALEPQTLRGTKVALSLDYGYIETDPEIRQAVLEASDLLRGLGCEVVESDPPRQPEVPGTIDTTGPDEYAWAVRLKPDFTEHLDELTGYGRRIIESGTSAPAWKYSAALRRREAWAAAVRRWFKDYDFLLSPVMGQTAPRCDEQRRPEDWLTWPGRFLPIFNASGNPAASVPFGFHSNGLPIGVQIVGRWGDDVGLLRMCAAIEAARPWADAWPAIARESAAAGELERTRGD